MLTITEERKLSFEIDDNNILWDRSEDSHFSWQGCDNCNDRLGNDVYDCKLFPSLEHARTGEYWEVQLCGKCVYESEYGIGSYEN